MIRAIGVRIDNLTYLVISYLIPVFITWCMVPTTSNLLNHRMSNPNTNALLSLLQNTGSNATASATGFKTVNIELNRFPVSVLEMSPLIGHIVKKLHV